MRIHFLIDFWYKKKKARIGSLVTNVWLPVRKVAWVDSFICKLAAER
jgi:hypothetical protein